MKIITALVLATVATWAHAHPLKAVESALHKEERYAQFVDVQAPGFSLADSADRAISLVDFKGKVVVLNFVYSRCQDVCPLHMVLIAKLQSMVNTAGMRDPVRFVTIATDEEDVQSTRAIMAGYAKSYGLDTRNWQFLYRTNAQPPATTRQIARAYGLEFTPAGKGMQMHGVATHVIDQSGRLRARFHGLKFEPVHLVSYVNALVNDDHSKH